MEYTLGGREWKECTPQELKAFMICSIYIGIKKLPNMRLYWMKSKPLFYCHVIAGIFSCNHFMALRRCLYITNPSKVCQERELSEYDKLWQMRWLLTWITNKCGELWNVGQRVTVDKMMVRYKGKYCPTRSLRSGD